MDAIFALRQLCEKYRRAHKNLHMVFIDLEKAYDRVPREVLWWALKEKGLPGKYVELVRAMYRGFCTYVRSSAGTTDQFSVAGGVKYFDEDKKVVVTSTIEAAKDLKEQLIHRFGEKAKSRVRTMASVLANGFSESIKI
ncbi:uncharacterized protein LOC135193963 [Vanessa tameamea]|uniref:Uncharacterized protein LOC135193963 n=1 Tax=Vanessa tameamea TaxID=334116 RepID=A0ABM4ATP6_VANTA